MKRLYVSLALAMIAANLNLADDKKVLMYSKSVGFQHDVVKRPSVDELSPAEKIVVNLGKKHGFEVTATKDGNLITADNLKKYDAILFYTQGELDQAGGAEKGKPGEPFPPMAKENRQAILDYINNGGGFIGTHCGGADTFHNWVEGDKKPFLDMVGGEFVSHGSQQPAIIDIVDKSHPAVAHLKPRVTMTDEWYAYKGFNKNMHVLIMLKSPEMRNNDKKHEWQYQRPEYPITWCSMYGKGRVFYTGMGHRDDVWASDDYQKMVAEAVLWSSKVKGDDVKPNLKELFGDEEKALERMNPPKEYGPKK